jgi:hypothetical protein
MTEEDARLNVFVGPILISGHTQIVLNLNVFHIYR